MEADLLPLKTCRELIFFIQNFYKESPASNQILIFKINIRRDTSLYQKLKLSTENVFDKYDKSQKFLWNFAALKGIVKKTHHFLLWFLYWEKSTNAPQLIAFRYLLWKQTIFRELCIILHKIMNPLSKILLELLEIIEISFILKDKWWSKLTFLVRFSLIQ